MSEYRVDPQTGALIFAPREDDDTELATAQKTIKELNKTVSDQSRLIANLEKRLTALEGKDE